MTAFPHPGGNTVFPLPDNEIMQEHIERLRYPIGTFVKPESISKKMVAEWIADIESFPAMIRMEVDTLTEEQLETPYRPKGWTIRQLVHHCADSHMNAFARFKLALTEDTPVIKPYLEAHWAMLPDTIGMPVEPSLSIIAGLHTRWTVLLKTLTASDFSRSFVHPEYPREMRLDETLALYAWHCRHHLAHARLAKG